MPPIMPHVTVRWRFLAPGDDGLRQSGCLYALLAPNKKEIVYIGKAGAATVAQRLRCRAKGAMWEHLDDCGIDGCYVLLGELMLHTNRRLTAEFLSDVESLLIMEEQPIANVQSTKSRITRPGLCVACAGYWPGHGKLYVDDDCYKVA